MQADPTRVASTGPCDTYQEQGNDDEWSNREPVVAGTDLDGGLTASRIRMARLVRTIEIDVIPRLVQAHRQPAANAAAAPVGPTAGELQAFVGQVLHGSDSDVNLAISSLRDRGATVETVYLQLLAPCARRLGEMWEEDDCDFSAVTVGLGRLQRLLRELSPAFGNEVQHPPLGRRALFVQPRGEQHSFGLSMVAEFFRREGWDVIGGVGGAVTDPASKVRDEWVDVIGFSIGTDHSLGWLTETIRLIRSASRNTALIVLVGGPPFTHQPGLAATIGADGTARDAKDAPALGEQLMSARLAKM